MGTKGDCRAGHGIHLSAGGPDGGWTEQRPRLGSREFIWGLPQGPGKPAMTVTAWQCAWPHQDLLQYPSIVP